MARSSSMAVQILQYCNNPSGSPPTNAPALFRENCERADRVYKIFRGIKVFIFATSIPFALAFKSYVAGSVIALIAAAAFKLTNWIETWSLKGRTHWIRQQHCSLAPQILKGCDLTEDLDMTDPAAANAGAPKKAPLLAWCAFSNNASAIRMIKLVNPAAFEKQKSVAIKFTSDTRIRALLE